MVTKLRATVLAWGIFYRSIVQSVLLYGSDIWAETGDMLKVLHRTLLKIGRAS